MTDFRTLESKAKKVLAFVEKERALARTALIGPAAVVASLEAAHKLHGSAADAANVFLVVASYVGVRGVRVRK